MRIDGVIWLRHIVDKLASKHQVTPEEVEEALTTSQNFGSWKRVSARGKMYRWLWEEAMKDATFRFCSSMS